MLTSTQLNWSHKSAPFALRSGIFYLCHNSSPNMIWSRFWRGSFCPTMESCHCLLLLLALVLAPGETRTNDDDNIDLGSFLRRIYPGLLVRDEPFVINREINLENFSISEDTKDKGGFNVAPGPVVLTKNGQIRGITVDKAHIFYGIPYADPPIGAYRWKPPRSVSPWSGVYDASFPRAACMQACAGPITEECPKIVSNIRTSHSWSFVQLEWKSHA